MNKLENKYPPRPINDPKRLLCDQIQNSNMFPTPPTKMNALT